MLLSEKYDKETANELIMEATANDVVHAVYAPRPYIKKRLVF